MPFILRPWRIAPNTIGWPDCCPSSPLGICSWNSDGVLSSGAFLCSASVAVSWRCAVQSRQSVISFRWMVTIDPAFFRFECAAELVLRWALPAGEQVVVEFDAQEVEGAVDGLVDHVGQRLRPVVEGRHGRHHHRPQLGYLDQEPEVPEVKGRLADEQYQRAALLERHVRGAQEQIVRVRGRDPGDRLDRAGGDDHPGRAEGSRRDRGGDVTRPVDHIGEGFHVAGGQVGLELERAPRRRAKDDMGLDVLDRTKHLEQPDPVDHSTGTAYADDEAPHADCRDLSSHSRNVTATPSGSRTSKSLAPHDTTCGGGAPILKESHAASRSLTSTTR